MLPQKISVQFQKCHFQHFLQDIFSKFMGRKMQNLFFFHPSLEFSIMNRVYGKKARIMVVKGKKKLLTQTQYSAKDVSVIPI